MISIIKGLSTVFTVGKKLVELKKEIDKGKKDLQNKIKPLETYAFEPNQNNVDIAKIKEDIIFIKNEFKRMKPNKKTKDKKWYDD